MANFRFGGIPIVSMITSTKRAGINVLLDNVVPSSKTPEYSMSEKLTFTSEIFLLYSFLLPLLIKILSLFYLDLLPFPIISIVIALDDPEGKKAEIPLL